MSISLQELQEYVTLAKDVVTTLSAVVVAVSAILGLKAWRKKLRAKNQYELARRLLRSVYALRDAISIVRNPLISGAEKVQAMREAGINTTSLSLTDPKYDALGTAAAYQRRWKFVADAFSDLQVDGLESEAVWGSDIAERLRPLRDSVHTLDVNIKLYVSNLTDPRRPLREKVESIIFATGREDEFAGKMEAAVGNVENYLSQYLQL